MAMQFPEIHKTRYVSLGKALFTSMGIQRGDREALTQHYMYMFFGAPAVVYFVIDGWLNEPYACLDIGSIGTTFCYLAYKGGLGTIYLAASMHFPDIVKDILDIPEDKKVVIGIAVGTAHPDIPASLFSSEKEPVENLLRFA